MAALVPAPGASASHVEETLSSSNYVLVNDFGSNAHGSGCGKRAALSGGFANKFDRQTSKLFLFAFSPIGRFSSFPFPGSTVPFGPSWRVTVANRAEGSRGGGKQVTFAYCVDRRPRLHLERARVPIEPSATATAIVRCPRGTEAVSGGFSDQYAGTNGSLVFGFRSERVGRRGWRASAINMSGSISSWLWVNVLCHPRGPGLRQRTRTIEVPADGATSTTIRCRGGREAWSAGFESRVEPPAGEGAFPYELRRVGDRSWRASAFAEGPAAAFTLHLYCAR